MALLSPPRAPLRSLIYIFLTWRTALLLFGALSPGPGYDTSSQLLVQLFSEKDNVSFVDLLTSKLARWDAIYFGAAAHRGYLYEQEWAFGWGFTRLVSALSKISLDEPNLLSHWWAAILVANVSHLLSVLVLYALVLEVLPDFSKFKQQLAVLTAALHILTPAGLFLSAPYAESLFSFLNFLGMLLYSRSTTIPRSASDAWSYDLVLLPAGIAFGIASTVRSNGLLSGLIFLDEFGSLLNNGLNTLPDLRKVRRLLLVGTAGVCVAVGMVYPQLIAYTAYCVKQPLDDTLLRPWCTQYPPSIYSWVQSHYWNVGFLRYWTVSNLPLFLLAIPMILGLAYSGTPNVLSTMLTAGDLAMAKTGTADPLNSSQAQRTRSKLLLRRLAWPQLVIAVFATTNFHVQIVNRISSGYPLWYVWVAMLILRQGKDSKASKLKDRGGNDERAKRSQQSYQFPSAEWVVRAMIMYAIIQGGLYASFLPPA